MNRPNSDSSSGTVAAVLPGLPQSVEA
jgi:hypothetical protein